MNLTLHPLTIDDAPTLAALHSAALREAWSEESFREMLALEGVQGWRLEESEAFAACILMRRTLDEAEILTLATHPDHRRRGYATRLLKHALATLAEEGCIRAYLELRKSNDAARALYEAHGFSATGQRPRYYPDGEDALVMRKLLIP